MGGPWRDRSVDGSNYPVPAPAWRAQAQDTRVASEAAAAIVGFVVALVTSLGVSIACFAYLR